MTTLMGKKAAALALMLSLSMVYSYAMLGLGERGPQNKAKERPLLTAKTNAPVRSFSLKSGYNFRGSQVISNPLPVNSIQLNTTYTYRLGGTTYSAPVTKKVAVSLNDHNQLQGATLRIQL